ncbi:hypothetical protein HQ590_08635 [bacterium]|nr:hypothetical protein [bacterium]
MTAGSMTDAQEGAKMEQWTEVKAAAVKYNLREQDIWELMKGLEVAWKRNGDGIYYVNGKDLACHEPDPRANPAPCLSLDQPQAIPADPDEWLRARAAQDAIGLPYSVAALWWARHTDGDKSRRLAPGMKCQYEYARWWCEQERVRRAKTGEQRDTGTMCNGRSFRRFRQEVKEFLDKHPGLPKSRLSAAAGMGVSEVAEITRRRKSCRRSTVDAIRAAMRAWPEDDSAEPTPTVKQSAKAGEPVKPGMLRKLFGWLLGKPRQEV